MKIRNRIKVILISLISVFLLSANVKTGNGIEDEVQKLFNGIPVQEGIQAIIKKSKYQFQYGKSIYMLGSHENWFTEIDVFEYLDSPTISTKLELNQSSQEKEMGCYDTSLRLFYEKEEIMIEEFFRIKEKFEELGDKVDTETILTDDYNIKSQTVIVYFKKGKQIPNLSFSFEKDEEPDQNQVFINYQNCLEK